MPQTRDHCPECDHKLHPQELEILYHGRKLECWYCHAPLKARASFNAQSIAQMMIGGWALIESFVSGGSAGPWPLIVAGIVVAALHLLPPGLVKGAPWVKIVNRDSGQRAEAS